MDNASNSLSFTREQLKAVLMDFIVFFDSQESRTAMKSLAPSEKNIEQYIEESQKKVFEKHGVHPQSGLQDLRRVSNFYKGDKEILQLLMLAAMKEETATDTALGHTNPLQKDIQERLAKGNIDEIQKYVDTLEPKAQKEYLAALQFYVAQLPPEQRQKIGMQLMTTMSAQEKEKAFQAIQQQFQHLPPEHREALMKQMQGMMPTQSTTPQTQSMSMSPSSVQPPQTTSMQSTAPSSAASTSTSPQGPGALQGPQTKELFRKR
jgi:hypothetical protein